MLPRKYSTDGICVLLTGRWLSELLWELVARNRKKTPVIIAREASTIRRGESEANTLRSRTSTMANTMI